jgi:hypothetical protein
MPLISNFNKICKTVYRIQTLPALGSSYASEGPAQVKFSPEPNWVQARSTTYVYTRESVKIQTSTHWNLMNHSMTAPSCVITQQYSSAPSSHCAFIPARKDSVHIWKVILSLLVLIFFLKLHKSEIAYVQGCLYKEKSIYDLTENWAVLGIKTAENRNHLTNFSGSIPYQVPTQSVEEFMGHLEKSSYSLMQSSLYYGSILLKL